MQNRVGSFLVSLEKKGKKVLIGLDLSVGDANEAVKAVATSALSSVVLPDPLGPMSTDHRRKPDIRLCYAISEPRQVGGSSRNTQVKNDFFADRMEVGYGKFVDHIAIITIFRRDGNIIGKK